MTITELREQGFDTNDYIIVPNNVYFDEYINKENKHYFLYIGRIAKYNAAYYLDGYVVNTNAFLECRNLHSTYSLWQRFDNHERISRIQPIFLKIEHIKVNDSFKIKKIDKTIFDNLLNKLTNVADDLFTEFLKS